MKCEPSFSLEKHVDTIEGIGYVNIMNTSKMTHTRVRNGNDVLWEWANGAIHAKNLSVALATMDVLCANHDSYATDELPPVDDRDEGAWIGADLSKLVWLAHRVDFWNRAVRRNAGVRGR